MSSDNLDLTLATSYLKSKVNALAKTKRPRTAKGLVKSMVKKAFDQRVMTIANPLFNAQASLALGASFLYRIDKYEIKKAGGVIEYAKKPAVIVTDPNEIKDYIDHIAQGGGYDEDDECEYYYIHTVKPDNQALDSMLNRTFGRAKESMDIDIDMKVSLKDLAKERLRLTRNENEITDATIIDDDNNPII